MSEGEWAVSVDSWLHAHELYLVLVVYAFLPNFSVQFCRAVRFIGQSCVIKHVGVFCPSVEAIPFQYVCIACPVRLQHLGPVEFLVLQQAIAKLLIRAVEAPDHIIELLPCKLRPIGAHVLQIEADVLHCFLQVEFELSDISLFLECRWLREVLLELTVDVHLVAVGRSTFIHRYD